MTKKQNGYLQSGLLREAVAYEKWSRGESLLYLIVLGGAWGPAGHQFG